MLPFEKKIVNGPGTSYKWTTAECNSFTKECVNLASMANAPDGADDFQLSKSVAWFSSRYSVVGSEITDPSFISIKSPNTDILLNTDDGARYSFRVDNSTNAGCHLHIDGVDFGVIKTAALGTDIPESYCKNGMMTIELKEGVPYVISDPSTEYLFGSGLNKWIRIGDQYIIGSETELNFGTGGAASSSYLKILSSNGAIYRDPEGDNDLLPMGIRTNIEEDYVPETDEVMALSFKAGKDINRNLITLNSLVSDLDSDMADAEDDVNYLMDKVTTNTTVNTIQTADIVELKDTKLDRENYTPTPLFQLQTDTDIFLLYDRYSIDDIVYSSIFHADSSDRTDSVQIDIGDMLGISNDDLMVDNSFLRLTWSLGQPDISAFWWDKLPEHKKGITTVALTRITSMYGVSQLGGCAKGTTDEWAFVTNYIAPNDKPMAGSASPRVYFNNADGARATATLYVVGLTIYPGKVDFIEPNLARQDAKFFKINAFPNVGNGTLILTNTSYGILVSGWWEDGSSSTSRTEVNFDISPNPFADTVEVAGIIATALGDPINDSNTVAADITLTTYGLRFTFNELDGFGRYRINGFIPNTNSDGG